LILAAGKGTRMNSAKNKVLHPLLGVPMVAYAVERGRDLGASPIVAVLGHQIDEVAKALELRFGPGFVTVVEQKEQKGTGHAVRLALGGLGGFDGLVTILYGDVPLLQRETLAALVAAAKKSGSLAILTSVAADPTGYGRVVRDDAGAIRSVVEHKDATPAERRIAEINAGIYTAPAAFLRKAVAKLSARNSQGEYYLTDIVARAAKTIGVVSVDAPLAETLGVNDREQLVAAERILVGRLVKKHMEYATFRTPDRVFVEAQVTIEPDAEIGRDVVLRGRTTIGAFARIGDGSILTDTVVGKGAEVLPYCVITESTIGEGAKVGPFAHLRPEKRQTIIEDGAFIGSDTRLVAPVRVGKRAVVAAAGATVTEDVREGALAISRIPCKQVDGHADRLAEGHAHKKTSG